MIGNLPVSEELLGAYLEGNLSGEESVKVRRIIDSDDNLSDLVDEISRDDIDWNVALEDTYAPDRLDFELPDIPEAIDMEVARLISVDFPGDENNGFEIHTDTEDIPFDILGFSNIHHYSVHVDPGNEALEELNGEDSPYPGYGPDDPDETPWDPDSL